jgi:hypothetical protein
MFLTIRSRILNFEQSAAAYRDGTQDEQACNAYKAYFANVRVNQERLAFFDGMMNVLTSLRIIRESYLGLETGKSCRGLDALLTRYSIED